MGGSKTEYPFREINIDTSEKNIVHGEKVLLESYKIIDLGELSFRLNHCIRFEKSILIIWNLHMKATIYTVNEKDILTQIENGFDVLNSAINVRM